MGVKSVIKGKENYLPSGLKSKNVTARFIKTEECCYLVCLSRQTIARLVKNDEFPSPVKGGTNDNKWLYSDIENWIMDKVAAAKEGNKNE